MVIINRASGKASSPLPERGSTFFSGAEAGRAEVRTIPSKDASVLGVPCDFRGGGAPYFRIVVPIAFCYH